MFCFNEIEDALNTSKNLLKKSSNLFSIKETRSYEEFESSLVEFETEVKKLQNVLISIFGEDEEIMRIIFTLKSMLVDLKMANVEPNRLS